MQTQTAAFKAAAASTVLYPVDRATLQTIDATIYNLGPGDIIAGSLSVDSSCFDDGIEIGSVVSAECSLGLNNADGRWDEVDLQDAILVPYSGLKLPDTTIEDFKLGTFIIDDPGYPYLQVTISASDRMLLLDEPFISVTRAFPATNLQILQAISTYCNVPLATSISGILNAAYSVTMRPTDDLTCRDVVGMIAMMAAGYARMNRDGELEIVQFPALIVDNTIDGNGTEPYEIDGTCTDDLYMIGGSLFTDTFGYQGEALEMTAETRYSFKQIREPVTVSGVQYNTADPALIIGADNYLVVIDECPLIQSGTDEVIQSIYDAIVGFTYTGFEAEYPGNPTIDLGDVIRHITPDGKTILSLVASHSFAHGQRSTLEATAKSAKEKRYKASVTAKVAAAQAAAAAASAKITALAPLGLVELAKLGETIISGGYIKTELLDVLTLIAGTLSNGVDSEFYIRTGDVAIGGETCYGIFGFLKSVSDTVPMFRLVVSSSGVIRLVDKNGYSRLFLSPTVIQIADGAGHTRYSADENNSMIFDASSGTRFSETPVSITLSLRNGDGHGNDSGGFWKKVGGSKVYL